MEKKIRKLIYGDHDPYLNAPVKELNLAGWASDSPVFNEVLTELKPKLIIEVGSWLGRSAVNMADILLKMGITDFEIVCVDTWLGSVEHWQGDAQLKGNLRNGRPTIYETFMSNIVHQGLTDYITPFPTDSINAAEFFKRNNVEADLVYIDAGHEYLSVKMDLYAYSTIVRPGGYMLGDDWFHAPIKEAVKDTFGDNVIEKSGDKFLWIR